ncbi:pyridoxamine 5'-phosphate oxidase family protein [Halopenitus persicus]|uniref:pyridoxamine 5'-phosphate oxidase family protein n=1 Tax=Halopenitus persicus TaxID=1048396 RepID=UPI000BBB4A55|nr:pyridoxamine 5'-phosphate oxidase family protein [Halopenitus persicus]
MTTQPSDDRPIEGETMSDAAIDAALQSHGAGVLALADGNDAYAIPISFGYDAGRVVFVYWQFGAESRKVAFTEATDRACLTVVEHRSPTDWRSVIVRGPLSPIEPDERTTVGKLMDENAWVPDLSVLEARRLSPIPYELSIEEATGLRGADADPLLE